MHSPETEPPVSRAVLSLVEESVIKKTVVLEVGVDLVRQ
jgi:hypothetical protein